MHFPNKGRGLFFMASGIFLLSISDVLLKLLSSAYSPFHIMFLRSFIALPFALLFLQKYQGFSAIFQVDIKAQLLRNGVLALSLLLSIYSLSLLPLAEYSVLFYSGPFFIALLSIPFLGESVSKTRWICILGGFIGILIALNPSPHQVIHFGGITSLAAAFFFGLGVVLSSQQSQKTSPLLMFIWNALIFSCIGFCGILFTPFSLSLLDIPYFLAISFLYIMAHLTFLKSFKYAPTSYTASLNYTSIIWATLFGYLIWNQWPTLNLMGGAILIIGSGVFMVLDGKKKTQKIILETLPQIE